MQYVTIYGIFVMVGGDIIKNKYGINNNKGFTLMELLAVIVILSIIGSITVYVVIGIINNAKEKGYMVTINEIEDSAKSYVIENNILGNNNYACVTVQQLIDFGYLKNDIVNSDVSNSRKALLTDKVYIEKNVTTKVIDEIDYLSEKCK